VGESEIRQSLLNNGWDPADVEAAFSGRTQSQDGAVSPAPNPASREEAIAAVRKMGRFRASWRLFKQSLHILQQDKEIVLFPILSSIILIVVGVLFSVGVWMAGILETEGESAVVTNEVLFYALFFAYYVIAYFILTYFRVGLTAVVYERINGRDINFKDGMSRASSIGGKIFVWSLLAGTVGIVLKIISERSKLLGKIAASLLGAAWNIVTMFIAPTLLLDNVSVWQSVKNSGTVFRKTWGETLIMNVSIGLVNFVVLFGTMVLFGVLASLSVSVGLGAAGLIVVFILFMCSFIAISVVFSSLSEIFKVALYSYARFGIIAEGFSPEFIVGAVKERIKK
jgi:uncharacterized Tic20 family protein